MKGIMNTQRGLNKSIIKATLNKCRKMGSKLLLQQQQQQQQQHYSSSSLSTTSACCTESCSSCFQRLKTHHKNNESIFIRLAKKSTTTLKVPKDVPKGHMALYVGQNMRRFVVKISLLKHPLFRALLDKARDEFDDSTTPLKLWIPCDEAMFLHVVRCASSVSDRCHWWRVGVFCL